MGKFPLRGVIITLAVLGLLIFVISQTGNRNKANTESLSTFLQQVESGDVSSVVLKGTSLSVVTKMGTEYETQLAAPLS